MPAIINEVTFNEPLPKFQVPDAYTTYISEEFRASLKRYFNDHVETGSFLKAVLCNDLEEAVKRATNDQTWDCLPHLVRMLYQEAPRNAYGSPEKVQDWLEQRETGYGFTHDEIEAMMEVERMEQIAREVVLKRERELEAMGQ
jgi:FPC/CPF motif-containing protein YcgG